MRSPSGPRFTWYEVAAAVAFVGVALTMAKIGVIY
jgi:hypothetical protein